jgi:hypothetical protein
MENIELQEYGNTDAMDVYQNRLNKHVLLDIYVMHQIKTKFGVYNIL